MPAEIAPWLCRNCGHKCVIDDITYPLFPDHLVKTNNPPSQHELFEFQEMLATEDLVQESATLSVEIASLQRTLDALHTRRAKMETHLKTCKSISSPLRRLPQEIILEILDWATSVEASADSTEREAVSWDTKRGIWAYSQVCQRWRAVALLTPPLWSTVAIRFASEGVQHFMSVHCLETILSRSAEHLLSVYFTYEQSLLDQKAMGLASRLLAALVKRSQRWREVSLVLRSPFLPALRFVQNHIPNLESLSLCIPTRSYDVPEGVNNYFQDAPALRKVAINLPQFGIRWLNLPWPQIAEFKGLSDMGANLRSLTLMHNLTSLALHCQQSNAALPRLELSNVRRLDVSASPKAIAIITLPALQELTVVADAVELVQMKALIERSRCRITSLELIPPNSPNSGWIDHPDVLLRFFGIITPLSVLNLSKGSTNDIFKICKILVSPEEHGKLLPALTELLLPIEVLEHWIKYRTNLTPLVQFLRQRRNPQLISSTACEIKSVVFVGGPEPLSPELQSLQRDGLSISFRRNRVAYDLRRWF